jgi:hypothetical protein
LPQRIIVCLGDSEYTENLSSIRHPEFISGSLMGEKINIYLRENNAYWIDPEINSG